MRSKYSGLHHETDLSQVLRDQNSIMLAVNRISYSLFQINQYHPDVCVTVTDTCVCAHHCKCIFPFNSLKARVIDAPFAIRQEIYVWGINIFTLANKSAKSSFHPNHSFHRMKYRWKKLCLHVNHPMHSSRIANYQFSKVTLFRQESYS